MSASRSRHMRPTITNHCAPSGRKRSRSAATPPTGAPRSRQDCGVRRARLRLANQRIIRRDFYPAIFEALFRSESWIALVMITDLLGRKDRFNVPGNRMPTRTGRGGCKPRSANWAAVPSCTDSFGSCASCLNEPDELGIPNEAQRSRRIPLRNGPGKCTRLGTSRSLHFARDDKLVNCG